MNANNIESKFAMLGARFNVSVVPAQTGSNDYAVDIQKDRLGQFFELRVPETQRHSLDVSVLQTDKRDRHLLLFIRRSEGKAARFLCGHDEREWFVAAVPGGASSVLQAKEALKPRAIQARQNTFRVPFRLRNRRKNRAFVRQGEWFFAPVSRWERGPINEKFVLFNEPLRRGNGKAHIVAHLYRVGGEVVYTCARHPRALNETQYRKLIQSHLTASSWAWQVQRRNPFVYARGTVRHPDHATIQLPDWHQVLMNTETETDTMRNVAFID